MRAIVKKYENKQEYELVNVKIPNINDHEMLVKVKAIGVGIQDTYYYPKNITYPYVIGIEAAGIIEAVGREVQGYEEGDRISFVSIDQKKGGTWADYVALKSTSLIIKIPDNMDYTTAAAIPMSADAALKALNSLDLKADDKIFITGGSGAIGTFLIQIAKQRGLIVSASASLKNHEYMQSLGASKTVDYNHKDWIKDIINWSDGGVAAAIAVQPNTSLDSMRVLKSNGQIVSVSGDAFVPFDNIINKYFSYQFNSLSKLHKLFKDVSKGKIKVELEHVYELEDAISALEKVTTRHARGKVIIKV